MKRNFRDRPTLGTNGWSRSVRRAIAGFITINTALVGCAERTLNQPAGPPSAIAMVTATVTLDAIGATEQLSVSVTDVAGNPVTNVTIGWDSSNPLVVTVDEGGVATAMAEGTASITATVGALNATAAVTVEQAPGEIAKVSGDAQSDVVTATLPQLIVAEVRDRLGTPVADVVVTFDAESGTASPPSTTSGVDGRVSTEWTLGTAAGAVALMVMTPNEEATVAFTATAAPGPSDRIEEVSGDDQSAPPNTPLASPLVVRVTDEYGNGIPNESVSFAVQSGGGSVTPSATTTSSSGLAQATWTVGASGVQEAQAQAAALTGSPVPFSATVDAAGANWTTIFSEDFEDSPNLSSLFQDRGEPQNHAVIVDASLAQSGTRLLRVTYPANSGGGWMTHWFGPMGNLGSLPDYQAARVSAWMRVSQGFQGPTRFMSVRGSHISDAFSAYGVAGQCPENPNSGLSFFSATLEGNGVGGSPGRFGFYNQWLGMPGNCWSQDGTIPGALATYFPGGGIQFSDGDWHFVEMEVVLNTIGQANGEHRIWLDNELRGEWTGLEWRNSTNVRINSFQIQPYTNGSHPQQFMWIDDLVVQVRTP